MTGQGATAVVHHITADTLWSRGAAMIVTCRITAAGRRALGNPSPGTIVIVDIDVESIAGTVSELTASIRLTTLLSVWLRAVPLARIDVGTRLQLRRLVAPRNGRAAPRRSRSRL